MCECLFAYIAYGRSIRVILKDNPHIKIYSNDVNHITLCMYILYYMHIYNIYIKYIDYNIYTIYIIITHRQLSFISLENISMSFLSNAQLEDSEYKEKIKFIIYRWYFEYNFLCVFEISIENCGVRLMFPLNRSINSDRPDINNLRLLFFLFRSDSAPICESPILNE